MPWHDARAESVCRCLVINGFAEHLSEDYIISGGKHDGQHLKLGVTVLDYLGAFMCQCSDRWKATGNDTLKLFFTCQDTKANTESAIWYRKLKARIVRICFDRALEDGESMDNSVAPVYRAHVTSMNIAFAQKGTAEVHAPAILPPCARLSSARVLRLTAPMRVPARYLRAQTP